MSLLDPDLLRRTHGRIGNRISVFRETASTNDLAMNLARGQEPEGTVIFAESQTKGRGQHGRYWQSAPGVGLWFSVFLRPRAEQEHLQKLTQLSAVALLQALSAFQLPIQIKRPNDIYCRGKKLAGILVETRLGDAPVAILGIGLNVNQQEADFQGEVSRTATSLFIETGRLWDRHLVAQAVLGQLDEYYAGFPENLPMIEDAFLANCDPELS